MPPAKLSDDEFLSIIKKHGITEKSAKLIGSNVRNINYRRRRLDGSGDRHRRRAGRPEPGQGVRREGQREPERNPESAGVVGGVIRGPPQEAERSSDSEDRGCRGRAPPTPVSQASFPLLFRRL